MKYYLTLVFALNLTLIFISCTSTEIVNRRAAKDIVKDYYESGKYDEEMNGVIKNAKEMFDKVEIKKSTKGGSVVIFDVDETALNNYGLAKLMDFG